MRKMQIVRTTDEPQQIHAVIKDTGQEDARLPEIDGRRELVSRRSKGLEIGL